MDVLFQGAESTIIRDGDTITKERKSKTYRHAAIDSQLTKTRHRKEVKVLRQLEAEGIFAPRLISEDETSKRITMSYVDGPTIREVLSEENLEAISSFIGKQLAEFHNLGLIHGDLTTSNMILLDDCVYFIDFGLTFTSTKVEDRAVDLHLLRCALESKHPLLFDKAFGYVHSSYALHAENAKEVLNRLEVVESRGRNKH